MVLLGREVWRGEWGAGGVLFLGDDTVASPDFGFDYHKTIYYVLLEGEDGTRETDRQRV